MSTKRSVFFLPKDLPHVKKVKTGIPLIVEILYGDAVGSENLLQTIDILFASAATCYHAGEHIDEEVEDLIKSRLEWWLGSQKGVMPITTAKGGQA